MEFVLIIVVVGLVILYIGDKEKKREYEENKAKEEKAKLEAEQEKLKTIRETDFFKMVSNSIDMWVRKDLNRQIEKEGHAYPDTFHINSTHISSYRDFNLNFNSNGYNNLTPEQQYDLGKALEVIGFDFKNDTEYGISLSPNNKYWDPIIGEMMSEHNSKFANPF